VIVEHLFRFPQQSSNQRQLPVINAAACDKPQRILHQKYPSCFFSIEAA